MSAPSTAIPGCNQQRTQPQSEVQSQQQQQDIANLAYALWQRRGCPQGSSELDWKEAEQTIQAQQQVTVIGR